MRPLEAHLPINLFGRHVVHDLAGLVCPTTPATVRPCVYLGEVLQLRVGEVVEVFVGESDAPRVPEHHEVDVARYLFWDVPAVIA